MSAVMTEPMLEIAIEIRVGGSPAPQGSKSFKGFRGGKAVMVESSRHLGPWRNAVRADALLERYRHPGWVPLDEPLTVAMVFTVSKPLAAPKRRRTWPMRMPDLSKFCRSTEDALTEAGIWKDDARVVEYQRLAKVYPGEDRDALEAPGALIRIYRMVEVL